MAKQVFTDTFFFFPPFSGSLPAIFQSLSAEWSAASSLPAPRWEQTAGSCPELACQAPCQPGRTCVPRSHACPHGERVPGSCTALAPAPGQALLCPGSAGSARPLGHSWVPSVSPGARRWQCQAVQVLVTSQLWGSASLCPHIHPPALPCSPGPLCQGASQDLSLGLKTHFLAGGAEVR